ncbi:hypothetical protein LMF57_12380 [Stenotrophomonas sp. SI-NJAU-1]|uniref:hypothetical protein n=1 Tax=Stenotrophomonas sp. SI-NJAU-1 TaxID=2886359 RepID=UPI001E2DB270|nr:hypothetical protein [Stenotrophomonas sp. SI-NJAU-1]UEX16812.1 hypothetical protein LMF57_12380 [Stenotrophomonas sp. SI-NJAU-1]
MNESSDIPFRLTQVAQKRLTAEQLAEARRRLEERPEDAYFNAVEAAIYVGRSTKTLKRAIDAGVGPARAKTVGADWTSALERASGDGGVPIRSGLAKKVTSNV